MTDEPNKPEAKPRAGRGLRIALFLSLALNVLVVGVVGGAMLRNDGPPARRAEIATAFDAGIGPYSLAMTREQRRSLGNRIGDYEHDFDRNRDETRAFVNEFLATLRTAPFDATRLADLITRMQAGLSQRQQIGSQALLAEIAAMSDAERVVFAEKLENALRRIARRH